MTLSTFSEMHSTNSQTFARKRDFTITPRRLLHYDNIRFCCFILTNKVGEWWSSCRAKPLNLGRGGSRSERTRTFWKIHFTNDDGWTMEVELRADTSEQRVVVLKRIKILNEKIVREKSPFLRRPPRVELLYFFTFLEFYDF